MGTALSEENVAYDARTYTQDAAAGRIGHVLEGIAVTAASAGGFSHVDAAVAYATRGGVGQLTARLSQLPTWSAAAKRWLVSFDFGITEPLAVEALAALPTSEVRVPNGQTVIAAKLLRPINTFHTKGYLFRGRGWRAPSGLVIGSANLSVSALATGAEAIVSQAWTATLSSYDRRQLASARTFLDWFDAVWVTADPLSAVLPAYKSLRRNQRYPRTPSDDSTPAAKAAALQPAGNEVHGTLAAQLAAGRAIWFEVIHLYVNLQSRGVGNQLDTPRGTRVFFGFDAKAVAKNHIFGNIEIQILGYSSVTRSVRYGNNQMDKVNLPVPGSQGPNSYDNSVLIFERDGLGSNGVARFRLVVTDNVGLARRKAQATASVDMPPMQGGRRYGLLF